MELAAEFKAHARHAMSALFAPGGEELVTCGMDAMVHVWAVPSFELVRSFRGHEKSVNGMCLTPDAGTLVTGSTDRTLRLWDYRTGELLKTLTGHTNTVTAPRLSPDGRWIASPSYDRTVRLWPFPEGTEQDASPMVLRRHPKNVISVAFTPDSKVLAASGIFDDIHLWSIPDGQRLDTLSGHSTAVGTLETAPDGGLLWSLGYGLGTDPVRRSPAGTAAEGLLLSGKLIAWSSSQTSGDWSVARSADLPDRRPSSFTLSSDGSKIGMTFEHGAGVLSTESLELLAFEKTPVKGMYGVAISPDGRLMATASADGRCRVWTVD